MIRHKKQVGELKGMVCPQCLSSGSLIVSSKDSRDFYGSITRRRTCENGHAWTTAEIIPVIAQSNYEQLHSLAEKVVDYDYALRAGVQGEELVKRYSSMIVLAMSLWQDTHL